MDDTWGTVPSHLLINLQILGPRGQGAGPEALSCRHPHLGWLSVGVRRLQEERATGLWNDESDRAFERMKQALLSAVGLHLVDPDGGFVLRTDASHYLDDGAFWSRVLAEGQRRTFSLTQGNTDGPAKAPHWHRDGPGKSVQRLD